MYARGDAIGWEQSRAFRNTFSITVKVDFLGVWYTSFPSKFMFFHSHSSSHLFSGTPLTLLACSLRDSRLPSRTTAFWSTDMPHPLTSAVPGLRRIWRAGQGVWNRFHSCSVRNIKRNELYWNWKRNGTTPTPQRICWKSGFLVSRLARERCDQALTDIWFQGVIAASTR